MTASHYMTCFVVKTVGHFMTCFVVKTASHYEYKELARSKLTIMINSSEEIYKNSNEWHKRMASVANVKKGEKATNQI